MEMSPTVLWRGALSGSLRGTPCFWSGGQWHGEDEHRRSAWSHFCPIIGVWCRCRSAPECPEGPTSGSFLVGSPGQGMWVMAWAQQELQRWEMAPIKPKLLNLGEYTAVPWSLQASPRSLLEFVFSDWQTAWFPPYLGPSYTIKVQKHKNYHPSANSSWRSSIHIEMMCMIQALCLQEWIK